MSVFTPAIPRQRTAGGRHRSTGFTPTQATVLEQELHVGLYRPGQFPHLEQRCVCAKTACGLVVVRAETPCTLHHERAEYKQSHESSDCTWIRRRWFGFL